MTHAEQPDLSMISLSTTDMHTDLQTLQVSGTVQVGINNLGVAISTPVRVTLFEDSNHNGLFNSGVDNELASQMTSTKDVQSLLTAEAELIMDIPVNGKVLFRDSPLYVMVDSDNRLTEANENNNLLSTAQLCQIDPDTVTFEPELKWEWTHGRVLNAPMVAPLQDTNNDGKINQFDIPSVVFSDDSGILYAVHGKTGQELWSMSNYRTNGFGHRAIADIDQDGMVEIITPLRGGGLFALEHTGEFKWQSAVRMYVQNGGASIADLNADGRPEIIVGNTVLNADGSLLWQGEGFTGNNGYGTFSVVADINLDGKQEVIAGASVYSSTGKTLWQNNQVGEGLVGIGNFNDDDYPEIVIVSSGEVFLLKHTGEIIWGPISIPFGGQGGAPTVADMDGDGLPEIGVAGAWRYVVFNHDGSLLWAVPTQDGSSHVTGSSVFDFEGDGKAEVVYADERYLRIYRGTDGKVLSEIPNISGTAYEYPVIVDVDNDNHSDIIVGGNYGIHVYQDKYNSWVNTRKIWNQYSYHVTNINDDGTVPAIETPSWLAHNTYRLNTLNTEKGILPTNVPDLTASQLQVNKTVLSVRIGNAGLLPSPEGVKVRFYENNPLVGDQLLGEVTMERLEAGAFQDIKLNVAALTEGATLYAFVDAHEQVSECNEINNTAWLGEQPDSFAPASCKFYAVNDKGLNQSQFLIFDVDSRMEKFTVRSLGALNIGYDLEGFAVHPKIHRLYGTSGDDVSAGKLPGHLYVIDAKTGGFTPIGFTGFMEVDSLTFSADGTLWGWAKEEGLITIDLVTGKGTLVIPSDVLVEDLTLAKTAEMTFYGAVNTDLWVFKPGTNSLKVACRNLPGETESLEMLTDTLLLLGTHKGSTLQVFDVKACQLVNEVSIPTEQFKDVEGLAVFTDECALGELVEKAIELNKQYKINNTQTSCLSLEALSPGDSVEGEGVAHPDLTISTSGNARLLAEGKEPLMYETKGKTNGCLGKISKGFADKDKHHDYTFQVAPDKVFSTFSLRLLDFGDMNTADADEHSISLVGYDAKGNIVSSDKLSYISKDGKAYIGEQSLGNLSKIGDACTAKSGDVGNYPYKIEGEGITTVKLLFNNNKTGHKASDINFAIGDLCFTVVPIPKGLPATLPRVLPRDYISDIVNESINVRQEDDLRTFSKQRLFEDLIDWQRQFIEDFINGLPSDVLRAFFEDLPNAVPAHYADKLLTEILEGFPESFQDQLFEGVTRAFIIERLTVRLVEAHSKLQNPYLQLLPLGILRNRLAEKGSDMMGKLTEDLLVDIDEEILFKLLQQVPSLSVDELLEDYGQ